MNLHLNMAPHPGRPMAPFFVIFVCLCYTVAIPPPYEPPIVSDECANSNSTGCGKSQDRVKRASENNQRFRYLYVSQCGIFSKKPSDAPSLQLAATNKTQEVAHEKAARMLFLMLRFMPPKFFTRLAAKGKAGIFAADEVVGDYPEYANTKDTPNCKNKCDGGCARTCASDGRKYDSLVGYSNQRAVVREDNVLCSGTDPLNGKLNVLMHEFAHNIHLHVLGVDFKRHAWLEQSFSGRYKVWDRGYATSDFKEYFAEATTSYFRTSLLGYQSAGMNKCGSKPNRKLCPDEFSSRQNLQTRDPLLFKLVNEMYSGERPYLEGRVGVCKW